MRNLIMPLAALCLIAPAAFAQPAPAAYKPPAGVPLLPTAVTRHGQFYVGGEYVGDGDKRQMIGQMYVEVWAPAHITKPYPIVFLHGFGGTGTVWMQTADGRKGWADYFVEQGYAVYITDGPARGRSLYNAERQPKQVTGNTEDNQRSLTNLREKGTWPQAKLHTQYPGTGKPGDPIFDAAFARGVQSIQSNAEQERLVQHAAAALLDRIGPAILITHSQAGPFGWLIADARPKLVKAIVAVEPGGPPFEDRVSRAPERAWGVTDIPITYDPPVTGPEQLKHEPEAAADGPGLLVCQKQAAPPRRLVNLVGLPIAIVTSEASYHAQYDHCTAAYLVQAGVANDHLRLERMGIHGNAHGMMGEKNNLQIAGVIAAWLKRKAM